MKIPRELRDLGWWVEDYAYALVRIVRGLAAGNPKNYLSGEGRPVLVVPGVWESWTFMVPLIKALHGDGHPVHVLAGLGRNTQAVDDTAQMLVRYLHEHDLHDVVLVAHSKGGLIGKYAMAFLDDDRRIQTMTAICSPFSGSRYAPYLILRSLRAFSPRDPTTLLLNEDARVNSRIVSVFGEFDPHIPEGSRLTGATNIEIRSGGHFRILGDPGTLRAVLSAANRRAQPTDMPDE